MKHAILFFALSMSYLIAKELPHTTVGFQKIQLLDKYVSEGASIGDINMDGQPDIIAGPLWWEGPYFKKSHAYAPVKTYPIKGPGLSAYSIHFFTFPDLITKDSWTDILKVGIPDQPAYLAINPGKQTYTSDNQTHQCKDCIAQSNVCNESPQYLNILGTGKQLLAYSKNHITLAEPDKDPAKPWKVLNISPKEPRFKVFMHGLGAGDINNDGLTDILEKQGWWEQPRGWDRKTPWQFHPYPFAPKQGGAQMFAYDIDGDGDTDVVTALNAHSWGLAWYEQIKKNRQIAFKKHMVMTDQPEGNPYGVCFSQPHAMACKDIDGDGIKDIVTGKCYYAHNGRDPGAEQPAVLYWFRTMRHKNGSTELVPYQIDNNSGVGRQISTGDLNGDGRSDIVVSNKKGVFAFIQKKVNPKKTYKKAFRKKIQKKKTKKKVIFYEGEHLNISKQEGNVVTQDLSTFSNGVWSNNAQLWWTGGEPGDSMTLSFNVPKTAGYQLGVAFTKAKDYGIIQISLDGKKIGNPIDLYNKDIEHTGTLKLGVQRLRSGPNKLEIKLIGAHPKAVKSYMVGIDYLLIHPGTQDELLNYRTIKKPTTARSQPKKGNVLDAVVLSPEDELRTFKLPKGFTAELVASEDQGLIKPISIAFDDAGRLWTQTAKDYPKDKDLAAFSNLGKDQVIVFDTPWKQGVQTPRVFARGLTMPVSVLPHDHGVFIIHGPDVLFLEDTNNDGKANKRTKLLQGFGIQDTHTTAHQLTRSPGGWITFSQGCNAFGDVTDVKGQKTPFHRALIGRFKPSGTHLQIIGAGCNNIWAWAINGEGRAFIHEANDFGYSQIPFERDATYPSFVTSKRYPESPYHPPTAKGLNLGGSGFSGIAIAEDKTNSFSAPWSNVHFIANPITGAINTVSYTIDDKGVYHFKKEQDFLSSTDPMFRPVAISMGPDGCLYIIDWYNRIISHNEVSVDHPSRDKVSGRIWRIRHKSQKRISPPNMITAKERDLVSHLLSGNIWQMRAAWHQISKRQAKTLIPALTLALSKRETSSTVKVHIIWCLESLGYFNTGLWGTLLKETNPNVRQEAIRALSSLQPELNTIHPLLSQLKKDSSFIVRNELVRFYRDTPQKLSTEHKDFLRSMLPAENQLPKKKVRGWKGEYLALGGSYEKAFLNLLIDKALNREKAPEPLPDETRWNKTLATHPEPSAKKKKSTHQEIQRLIKANQDLKGHITNGKTIYTQRCAACHDSELRGFAPALNGGKKRSAESIITSILDPNAAVESVFHSYRVIKKDGSTLEGFRSDLTHKDLTLTYMGGSKIKIPLKEIEKAGYIKGKSVMIEGMGAGLTDQQWSDLITYLQTLK